MTVYIKREYAVDAVLDVYYDTPDIDLSGEKFEAAILKIPVADVAPVRHGRWIHTDLAAHWYGKDECSECTYHEHDRRDLSHFNYCPNCGAKMDRGDGNSTMA